jgi:hypothetical protein
MYIGHLILGAGFALLAWSHLLALALTGAAIAAFGSPLGDLIMVTMIQTDFPRDHIGKIYSMRALIGGIGVSLGTLAAAPLFQWLSVQNGILACALGIAGIGMIGIVRFTYGEKPDLKEPLHKKGIGHSP